MKRITLPLAALSTCVLFSAHATAHHSFAAEFDADKVLELRGTVLKVDWTNPHTFIYMEVEGDNGAFEEWAMEMGSPNNLIRRGWTRDTLTPGEDVIVRGTQARDGSNKGNVQTVLLAGTCEPLFAGTSQREFVEDSAFLSDCGSN